MKEDKKEEKVVAFMPDISMKQHKKLYKTTYVDNKGNIVTTIHDGNFNPFPPAEPDYLCFTAEKAGSTLRIAGAVTGDCTLTIPSFEYSTDDGATWNTWNFTNGEPDESGDYERISDTLTFAEIGDKVLVRGNCPDGTAGGEPVLDNGEPGMVHYFAGGEDTEAEDNVFAIGGDLQTLVDKTGETKTAPCFAFLFNREAGMTITSAPKLTATNLSAASYMGLFGEQRYLTAPAEMGALTNASLPNVNPDTGEGAYAMGYMYAETGITSMPDVSGIVLDKNSTYQDYMNVHFALDSIAAVCKDVLVTSDNGKTLNGFTGIDLSEDALANYATFVGVETLSAILFSFNFFGNINGFYVALVDMLSNGEHMGEVTTSDEYIPFDGTQAFWIEDGVSKDITLTASAHGGYQFSKWQTKSSESDEWTDDAEHLTGTLTFTAEPDENYYYKAVFEAESDNKVNVGYLPNECDITFTDGTDNVRTLEYGQDEDFPSDIYSSAELVKQGLFVKQGDSITFGLECSPKQGYEFVKWMGLDNGEWIQLDTAQTIYRTYGSPNDILVNLKAICQQVQ